MKNGLIALCLSIGLIFGTAMLPATPPQPILVVSKVTPQEMLDVSVMVEARGSTGTGVLFVRGDDTYVVTATHVVESLKTKKDGKVTYLPATIKQRIMKRGKFAGNIQLSATVVRTSDMHNSYDLALLKVSSGKHFKRGATIYRGLIPQVGTKVCHVGSLMGPIGEGSFSEGIVSQHYRSFAGAGVHLDQTTAIIYPGSSGGGVFLPNGQLVGIVTRGIGPGVAFYVPARLLLRWAKQSGIDWVFDSSGVMPPKKL